MVLGDKGDAVRALQTYLTTKGFYRGAIDGSFGPSTKKAVIDLQQIIGVSQTGEWSDGLKTLYEAKLVQFQTYTVVKGDTLWAIAQRNNTTYQSIAQLNVIEDPDLIFPGQQLLLPKSSSKTTASVTIKDSDVPLVSSNFKKFEEVKGINTIVVDKIECYIINLNTSKKIFFYITPESISESKTAMFEEQSPRGRSSPYQDYTGSGPREVNATFILWADYCPEGIMETVKAIRALVYPHKESYTIAPKALLRLGNFINVTGAVTSVNIDWQKPYKDGVYSHAEVAISITEHEEFSRTAKEVELNG